MKTHVNIRIKTNETQGPQTRRTGTRWDRPPTPLSPSVERQLVREREADRALGIDRQVNERARRVDSRIARTTRTCRSDAKAQREREDLEDWTEMKEMLGLRLHEETFEEQVARERGWNAR